MEEELVRADAVFLGEAAGIGILGDLLELLGLRSDLFHVSEVWKGPAAAYLRVGQSACPFRFQRGERYLVFAYESSGLWTSLHTSFCSPSVSLEMAARGALLEMPQSIWRNERFPVGYETEALLPAMAAGKVDRVRELLARGADTNQVNSSGKRPLSIASEAGQIDMVRALLEAGTDPNQRNDDRSQALDLAAGRGHLDVVRVLLSAGARPSPNALNESAGLGQEGTLVALLDSGADVNGEGVHALWLAARRGDLAIVKILLQRGARVTTADIEAAALSGVTEVFRSVSAAREEGPDFTRPNRPLSIDAVMQAARALDASILAWFLEQGVDPNLTASSGLTPLHAAAAGGSLPAARLLLDAGADADRRDNRGWTALMFAASSGRSIEIADLLLGHRAEVDARNDVGETPLILAAGEGHRDLVRFLLRRGAKINTVSPERFVNTAVSAAVERGDQELITFLLEAGADVNAGVPASLYYAAARGDVPTVKFLLGAGAEINPKEWSPLEGASNKGHLEVVRLLLDRGAVVDGMTGDTALRHAAFRDDADMTRLLLERGAQVNRLVGEGGSALHSAAIRGAVRVLRILLEAGADPNARNGNGVTPLMFVVDPRTDMLPEIRLEMTKLLLDSGASTDLRDDSGKTALSIAEPLNNVSLNGLLSRR